MEPQPFVLERVFDAPATNVWKAITQNDYLKQWYFNIPDFKAKVGFEFTFESRGSCTQQVRSFSVRSRK
jgi:uncharacterized protein YndB with AHSA1/START domain